VTTGSQQGLALLARVLVDPGDTIVAEGDPYGMIRFEGEHLPPIAKWSDRTLRLRSTSKIVAPGLRLGFMLGPEDLIAHLVVAKQAADLHTRTLDQHLLRELVVEQPRWLDRHIEEIIPTYRAGRDALVSAVQSTFGEDVLWRIPEGGMFLWIDLHHGTDTTVALERALDAGVAYVPGSTFAVDKPNVDALRLAYATATPEQLAEAVPRLATALRLPCNFVFSARGAGRKDKITGFGFWVGQFGLGVLG
jgi:2-aminoadipate transaminase